MTGAGAATVAFVKADSFLSIPGTPTYYRPGRDESITDLTLDRALERQRAPSKVFAETSTAENIEGAFAIDFSVDSDRLADVHDIVFTDPNSDPCLTPGRAASSRFYVGLDYLSGTAERVLKGCVPLDYSVSYSQGAPITVSVSFAYADEKRNTSVTPSSIQGPTGSTAQFHSADLTLGGTVQSKEQSATLSISNISRFQRGSDAVPVDAVVGAAEADLELTTILTETDQHELAYGGSGQSSTTDTMDEVSGSFALSAAGSTITTYSLSAVKPATYGWSDVVSADADAAENINFHVNGVGIA